MLSRITRIACPSASISSTSAAPRDSASSPTAPEPAYRSSTAAPRSVPRIEVTVPNSPSLARSLVGLVPWPAGTASLLPPAAPAMIRVMWPLASGLLQVFRLLLLQQRADRGSQPPVAGQRRVGVDQFRGGAAGQADQLLVGQQGQQLQARLAPRLGRAEHVTFPALLEIEPGQREPVKRRGDRVQPLPGLAACLGLGDQQAQALVAAPADPPSQLVQ